MAEPILLMGRSGTGKSSSLRNLNPETTIVIKPNAKSFPFPNGSKYIKGKNLFYTSELDDIARTISSISEKAPNIKTIVLEDFTHFFNARIFSPTFLSRNEGGEAFQRWNEFGAAVFQAIFAKSGQWRDDLVILVIHHTEVKEDGTISFKSSGKLLDNTIEFISYFNYVFHSVTLQKDKGVQYMIQTNKDAAREAKTPYGLFTTNELYIPNDIVPILDKISKYKKGELQIEWK